LGGVTVSAYFVSNGNEEKTLRAPEKEKADPSPIRAARVWAQDDNEKQRREAKTRSKDEKQRREAKTKERRQVTQESSTPAAET
jgi:hypothetical protein